MNYNIALIVWIAFVAILAWYIDFHRVEHVLGKKEVRVRPGMALLVMAPVIILAGMRNLSYSDTSVYAENFRNMPVAIAEIPIYMDTITKDKGFSLFSCLIKIFITTEPRVYIFIIALIQGVIIAMVFRKYSENYILSIFLFIASTDYLAWMYNGIRQFLAVTLIFAATDYMMDKKYLRAILIILFASTIHASALIMIPILFIVQGKAWNVKTVLIIFASLLALQFVDQFTDILENALADTQYTNAVSNWESWNDDGTNMLRVLIYSTPAILSFVGIRYIKAENDTVVNVTTNAVIISAGLYFVSSATSGIFVGRLPIYVSLYGYILLPWMIEHFFTKGSQFIVKGIMIICYLGFYVYSLMNGMGAGAW